MSREIDIPLTQLMETTVMAAAALATAAAGLGILTAQIGMASGRLAAELGQEALSGWRDLLAGLAEPQAVPAGGETVPLRVLATPLGDLELVRQALRMERLDWTEADSAVGTMELLVRDAKGHLALTLHPAATGTTAWIVDGAGLAEIADAALRLRLLAQLSSNPDAILKRLVRRYAALKVAATLRSAGMEVREDDKGVVRATTVDGATGGTRTIVFDAFGAQEARLATRHSRPGAGSGPCSTDDEAIVRAALTFPAQISDAGATHVPVMTRAVKIKRTHTEDRSAH